MAFTDRLANRGSISTGFDIENSCRFDNWYNYTQANTGPDDTGDEYLYRDNMLNDISTYDSDNGQKWVLSFWIKRGGRWVGNPYQNKGSYGHTSDAVRNRQAIWGSSNSARYSWFGFDSMTDNEDALIFDMKIGGVGHEFITNAQYRDHAAWYHIFVKMDTTQATIGMGRFKVI